MLFVKTAGNLTLNMIFNRSNQYALLNRLVTAFWLVAMTAMLTACFHGNDDDDDDRVDKTISGLDVRPANNTCIAPPIGPVSSGNISLQPAFPNLPPLGALVSLKQAPGDTSGQWYATLQDGRIVVFDNDPAVNSTTEFLNISGRVNAGGERGLLGMAFHPDYNNNGEIYLYYSTNSPVANHRSHISRFTFSNDQWNEEVILAVDQPFGNHNGGNILFGPADGYLYIGLGDGGDANDPLRHGQNTRTLLGSMLRIDVNGDAPYTIPENNPFAGNALCNNPLTVTNPANCPEIYAYGLRNPWRWSFDKTEHTLWLGDVGQNQIEEIDIINNGGNYGWVPMEGSRCVYNENCNSEGQYILPVAEYSHGNGRRSIVGGYVYRGNDPELSFLYGTYLYADTYSSEIFGTTENNGDYISEVLLPSQGFLVYSFAEASNGDVFVLAYNDSNTGGSIYKVSVSDDTVVPSPVAQTLSDTGCFSSTNPPVPESGLIPYEVISPLWSDGARKERYFAIPDGERINLSVLGDFIFPTGSVLVKHFLLNDRYVETRLLMHHQNGWAGYSYEWEYDQDGNPVEANLLQQEKTKLIEGQNWFYPGPVQCFDCHTNVANISLGLEALQLNRTFTYQSSGRTANQLLTFSEIGLFNQPLRNLHLAFSLYPLDDESVSYQARAKSYLHANCSHCHRTYGPAPTTMDFHFYLGLSDMGICNEDPSQGDLGITGIKLIDPAGTYASPNSMLVTRMETSDTDVRMPPLASAINDDDALDIMKNWINNLVSCN